MKRIDDKQAWTAAFLGCPFGPPYARVQRAHDRGNSDDLLDCPGVCLKSKRAEDDEGAGFRLTGKLVSYNEDEVLVRSVPAAFNGDLKCVWRGTPAEYARM